MKSLSIDTVLFTIRDGRLSTLLTRRPGTVWRIPGGPPQPAEPIAEAAARSLGDQTDVRGVELEQLCTFDLPPTGVRVAYVGLVAGSRHTVRPGAEELEARWFAVEDLPQVAEADRRAIVEARERVRAKAAYAPVAAALLPEAFTVSELKVAYEAALGVELDARNFRRDVLAAGVLADTGRTNATGPGRPARLYRWKGGHFAVAASERRAARTIAVVGGVPAG